MAISEFPMGMTGLEVLTKLELEKDAKITKLHLLGLTFAAYKSDQVDAATAFAWLDSHGDTVGDIHLDNRTIQGAKGKMELQFLKTAVLWGAEQVLSAIDGDPIDWKATNQQAVDFAATNLSKQKAEAIKKLADQINKENAPPAPPTFTNTDGDYDMPPYFPTDKLKSADTVKLSTATQMYQPVLGTSANSRYFVVGISDEIKVAARLKGVSVSIRLEGPALDKKTFNDAMKAVGISGGKVGQYASMHIEAPDPITAQKAIGSVLSALPVQWQTPMPSVGHLQGLGS